MNPAASNDKFRLAYLDTGDLLRLLRQTKDGEVLRREGGDVLPEDARIVAIHHNDQWFYPGFEILLYSDHWPEHGSSGIATFRKPSEVWWLVKKGYEWEAVPKEAAPV